MFHNYVKYNLDRHLRGKCDWRGGVLVHILLGVSVAGDLARLPLCFFLFRVSQDLIGLDVSWQVPASSSIP